MSRNISPVLCISFVLLWMACGGGQRDPKTPTAQVQETDDKDDSGLDFDPESLVRFDIIADVESLAPGQKATLAARFEIASGWHLYWINPGESGLPTEVVFEAAEGIDLGPARYPGPLLFDSDGETVNYGYRGTLLLPVAIAAQQELGADGVDISATATWLACRASDCVPGRGEAGLALPRSNRASAVPAANAAPIAAALSELSKPLRELKAMGVEFGVAPAQGGARLHFRATGGASIDVFPLHESVVAEVAREANNKSDLSFTLSAHEDAEQLAVLAIRSESVTQYFEITSALLAGP